MTANPEDAITRAALKRLEEGAQGRTREVLCALTRHLHAFIREIEPSEPEWHAAIRFLTETGRKFDCLFSQTCFVENGKIRYLRGLWNAADMYNQVGWDLAGLKR